jgi:ATP-dependent helicase/nuclease subunit A
MSDYLADDRPIDEAEFTRRACDPRASVVVEACAGSGKTWLLVSRIVRLLLDGSAPGEILAITFTRRAAQEMRTRLLRDLQELAAADDATIVAVLVERGMSESAARAATGAARGLYERVVTASAPITIETFHGWFWQLIARAPLGAGVPFAPLLLESSDRLRMDAWLHFSAALLQPSRRAEREAWEALIDELGDVPARNLLLQMLERRAEWWSFADGDEGRAIERALAPLRASVAGEPCSRLRDEEFLQHLESLIELWRSVQGLATTEQAISRAEAWLRARKQPARDFYDACQLLLTKEMTPIVQLTPQRMAGRLERADDVQRYSEAHSRAVELLEQVRVARRSWRALQINKAGLACGCLLIATYQRLKLEQRAVDFTDLEWHAHRLLSDEDHAAYMQARLDARYRHILLDEFQDTNPLQWQVLQSWLAAYEPPDPEAPEQTGDGRPTVFVVGDPKQSIYRFRRADPRIFEAAAAMLSRQYRAAHLRTNVTRRNAAVVTEALNRSMDAGNPLFQAQSTRAPAAGAFVLLPLAVASPAATVMAADGALRDVLITPRAEPDRDVHYREGCALANEVARWVQCASVDTPEGSRPAQWSDALLLVRRRDHLRDYERALRDAGVPFISDRRGGLLSTLEADDLAALLAFLSAPHSDLKLAQALRSPIFGCGDLDLIQLAGAPSAPWWIRLQALEPLSAALDEARTKLRRWIGLAGVLPVHDLLDRIYFEGDIRRRYAAVVPATMHAQVQANLDAFIELALTLDSGRYPSLPRFIDELAAMIRYPGDNAPNEGPAVGGDAVRVMTIHGAKGLEAEIVALADAHARPAPEAESVLVAWPPGAAAPEHVSLVARGEEGRDEARRCWFDEDDAQRLQEDWNLLYVAATRARQVLIVSGCQPAKGTLDDSWYLRLQRAGDLALPATPATNRPRATVVRHVRDFLPERHGVGGRIDRLVDSDAMRLGRAWHAMLEGNEFALAGAAAYGLTPEQWQQATAAARLVRSRLPHFFTAGTAELDLVAEDGTLLRVDRLVELDDALWILDFKWRVSATERPQYEAQVRNYAQVLRAVRSDKPVRLALVTADGAVSEVAG